MKNPDTEIRQYFLEKLAGLEIPVGNIFQSFETPPFVVIATGSAYAGTKDSVEWTTTTTFQVVIKTSGDWGGDAEAEEKMNVIIGLISATAPDYGETENFQIVTQKIKSTESAIDLSATGKIIRKIMVVENFVTQKN